MFPENSLGDIVSFLKDLKGLLPIVTATDRLNGGLYDLKNVIGVVYSMMYGIPVEQVMATHIRYEGAEESILKLATKVNEDVIRNLQDIKRDLTEDVEALRQENRGLEEENACLLRNQQSLGEKVDELGKQRDEIEISIGNLKKELRQLEESGKQEAEAHIEERKKELDNELEEHRKQVEKDKKNATSSISTEVATLEKRKQTLQDAIRELETALANFDNRIASLSSPQVEDDGKVTVRWEPIRQGDPIYNVSNNTFGRYYDALIKRYMTETNCTKDEAEKQFILNCPELSSFKLILEDYCRNYDQDNTTILEFCDGGYRITTQAINFVSNLKLPVYEKTKGKTINSIIPVSSTPPANVQTLLQVLELQKQLIKANADARINQMYVNTLIQILASVTPPEMDLSNLLTTYGLSSEAIQLLTSSSSEEKEPGKGK